MNGTLVALLGYAIAEVLRGRRRTLSSIIGIVLAVAFISGTFIAIDSSLRAVAQSDLDALQADYVMHVVTNQTRELVSALRNVTGLASVAPYLHLQADAAGRWGEAPASSVSVLAVDPEELPRVFRDTQMEGPLRLIRGNATLSEFLAAEIGAVVGNSIYLQGTAYDPTTGSTETRFVNLTVESIVRFPPDRQPVRFSSSMPSERFAAVHLQDGPWLLESLLGREQQGVTVEITADRDLLFDPFNVDASRRNFARLELELQEVASAFGSATVDNLVAIVVGNAERALPLFRAVYLALSIPLIVLAIMLGAIGVDLAHAERRRELAILKTRGASTRQVRGVLVLESVVVGTVAAMAGLIAGIGMSRLVAPFATFWVVLTPRAEAIVFSPTTVGITISFGILLAFAAGFRSAKRTAKLPIVETLRYYVPGETKIEYRPALDVLLVALGAGLYAVDLGTLVFGGSLVSLLTGPAYFLLLPLAPFLVLIGLTRFATRSTSRLYETIGGLVGGFARNLRAVISRNIARNPRRASNIAVLIALGVGFGVFILSLNQSYVLRETGALRASIGADLAGMAPLDDETFINNVTLVPGVAATTFLFHIPATLAIPPTSFGSASVFALDPDTYFATTLPEPWYFVDGGPESTRQLLSTSGRVVVSQALLREAFLEVGDTLRVDYSVPNAAGGTLDVVIGGVVRGLPGFPGPSNAVPRAVYGSVHTFNAVLSAWSMAGAEVPARFLVDLTPAADGPAAKEAVLELGATDVRLLEEEGIAGRNTAAINILGFFGLQIGLVLVFLTVGLSLIIYAASLEREVEFAGIIARGASGWQAAALLLGEGFSIAVIGCLVGVGAGVAASWGVARVLGPGPGGQEAELLVPYPFVIPVEVALLVGLAFLVMVIASLLVSWRIAGMDVPRVLKSRGG